MPLKQRSASERITNAFPKLSAAAHELNAASDELGKSVLALEQALKRLNLGIPAWVDIERWEDGNGQFSARRLGYAKVSGKWGLAISANSGSYGDEESQNYDSWAFNDAPREMRIEAVEHIPDLLEQLIVQSTQIAGKIRGKVNEAQEFAKTLNELVLGSVNQHK